VSEDVSWLDHLCIHLLVDWLVDQVEWVLVQGGVLLGELVQGGVLDWVDDVLNIQFLLHVWGVDWVDSLDQTCLWCEYWEYVLDEARFLCEYWVDEVGFWCNNFNGLCVDWWKDLLGLVDQVGSDLAHWLLYEWGGEGSEDGGLDKWGL